ncbi:MAG: 4Fe-4S binding protein [Myxococcales bacterium]|nr:4Fe-4S binding protein [Myxococcales bacterium]
MSRAAITRRASQLGILGLLLAMPILGAAKIEFLRGTLCSLGTDSLYLSCPLGVLQTTLASRSFDPGLWASAAAFLLLAFIAGRVFCSHLCPQGLLSELNDRLRRIGRRRRGGPEARDASEAGPGALARVAGLTLAALERRRERPDSPRRRRVGQRLLYGTLALGLLASFAIGVPIFCYVCPIGILSRALVEATTFGQLGGELAVIFVILIVELTAARRGWCKYICPVGALYGICSTKHTRHLERDAEACSGCRTCERECSMGNSPIQEAVGRTCTNCGDCIETCPEGALALVQLRRKRQ